MLKIGDFSKLSRISIRMLRHYDEIGLLVPERVEETTGYRYYSETQLPLAGRIGALRALGFSLAVTAEILHSCGDPQALRRYLLLRRAELEEQARRTEDQLLLLTATIDRLGKDEYSLDYQVSIKELPQRTVASCRGIIPAYDQEGILWERMMREISPMNVHMASPCNSLAIFHDAEYKEQDPDVEVQVSVLGSYPDTEHVVFQTVPPVLVASATYQGGYDQLTAVNEAVANWVKDNHYAYDGAMFTIYHVSKAQTSDPDELVTEVCYPVKKR